MDVYFIKGFIKNTFLGLDGAWEILEHFNRENEDLVILIYKIIKACKSIEDWTLSVRLDGIKSPFKYGLSENDIRRMNFNKQIEVLQYYCNVYLLLYHLSKSTLDELDRNYKEHLELPHLKGGDYIEEYIIRCNEKIRGKWNRTIL